MVVALWIVSLCALWGFHYIGCKRSIESISTRWLIAIFLPSWIVGSPSTVLKIAHFFGMSPPIKKFAIELQSATIFNGVTVPVIMIIMFAFGLIIVVVLTTLKCCCNREVFCSLIYHLSLGLILKNNRIGLSNVGQQWYHENLTVDHQNSCWGPWETTSFNHFLFALGVPSIDHKWE